MAAIRRAAFGYFFLVFMVRIVGRRPGKQMNPFEFVLIFFIGGLALTFIVADDKSLTNAFTQIITIGLSHYLLVLLHQRSKRITRLLDGTPMVLLENGKWHEEVMRGMSIDPEDVRTNARDNGISFTRGRCLCCARAQRRNHNRACPKGVAHYADRNTDQPGRGFCFQSQR